LVLDEVDVVVVVFFFVAPDPAALVVDVFAAGLGLGTGEVPLTLRW